MDKIGIIVTARVKSNRIHEKVFQKIGNKTAIEILLDNVINDQYEVVLAIPKNKDDDRLAEIGLEKGVPVWRGYDDSPLHRLYYCACENNFDHIVRITADDILIDTDVLFSQIKFHLRGGQDYTYCIKMLQGAGAEIIKTSILEKVIDDLGDINIEHVSYFVKQGFKTKEFYPPSSYQYSYRCVMDYPEDLRLLKIIYNHIPEPVKSLDVIHYLRKNKNLLSVNHLPLVTIYTCNYNMSDYIIDCIQSVMDQSYDDIEYIFFDDYSNDDSLGKVTEFYTKLSYNKKQKFKIYRNDKNMGLTATSNRALEMTRGRYVMRLDADDILYSDCIKTMLDEMQINVCNGVISQFDYCDENNKIIKSEIENKWHPSCALLSTWCANELKYQENLKYLDGEEFYKRFKERYEIFFVKKPLWSYRQHENQKTKQKDHPNNKELKQ